MHKEVQELVEEKNFGDLPRRVVWCLFRRSEFLETFPCPSNYRNVYKSEFSLTPADTKKPGHVTFASVTRQGGPPTNPARTESGLRRIGIRRITQIERYNLEDTRGKLLEPDLPVAHHKSFWRRE